jgi:hypothetical protein
MKKFPVCAKHLPNTTHHSFQRTTEGTCCKCGEPAEFVVYAATASLIGRLQEGQHIQKLKGKDYVLLSGLLMLAHENGLESIETELLEHDRKNRFALCRSTVKGTRGTFTGTGDADPENCGKMIAMAYIRMAETRSICRALRWYLGIGMTARDELPSIDKK